MTNVFLNVADIRHRSRVNGPGLRSVVWVQGCTMGCPGCFNPHTHPHEPKFLVDPMELGHRLAAVPDTDGITISGGEPFEQAEACAVLAETIRTSGLSVMVFTGHRYEVLRKCSIPKVKRLLSAIDLLVAGPYVQTLPADGVLWRASTNQTVHLLTDRFRGTIDKHSEPSPNVEVVFDGTAGAYTGFPDKGDQQWLDRIVGKPRPP